MIRGNIDTVELQLTNTGLKTGIMRMGLLVMSCTLIHVSPVMKPKAYSPFLGCLMRTHSLNAFAASLSGFNAALTWLGIGERLQMSTDGGYLLGCWIDVLNQRQEFDNPFPDRQHKASSPWRHKHACHSVVDVVALDGRTDNENEYHGCHETQSEYFKSNEFLVQRREECIEEVQKPPSQVDRHRNGEQNGTDTPHN